MKASRTFRVRRLLPLLPIFSGLAVLPPSALAVIPAGTMPMTQSGVSSVPNPPPPLPPSIHSSGGTTVAPGLGNGRISGGGVPTPQSNPEPASWILAAIGAIMTALLYLAHRFFGGAFPGGRAVLRGQLLLNLCRNGLPGDPIVGPPKYEPV